MSAAVPGPLAAYAVEVDGASELADYEIVTEMGQVVDCRIPVTAECEDELRRIIDRTRCAPESRNKPCRPGLAKSNPRYMTALERAIARGEASR